MVFRGDVGGNHAVPVIMDVEMMMSPQVRLWIGYKPSCLIGSDTEIAFIYGVNSHDYIGMRTIAYNEIFH